MAMECVKVIDNTHEELVVCIAYDKVRKEIYSVAEGDRVIKVWDFKTGTLQRVQSGHRGWVTCLTFATTVKLLFSGSVDGNIGVWTEKGSLLQMVPAPNGSVFCLAWDAKLRHLVAGGHSVLTIFKIDLAETQRLKQARRAAQHDMSQQPSFGAAAAAAVAAPDGPQVLKKQKVLTKGSETHTDVVKCIVITESGKLVTGGYDKAICIYPPDLVEKMEVPCLKVKHAHTAGINSMSYDTYNNCIITGSIDGSFKVWTMEGRCLDKFESVSDKATSVTFIASTNMYWVTGRFERLVGFDPRAPANVTEYIADPNKLFEHRVHLLYTPPGTELVLGTTRDRKIVAWQYNRHAAYRVFSKHEDWVEGILVVRKSEELGGEHIYSHSADGCVLHWQQDVEQNCDIFYCVEEVQVHDSNIYCMVYSHERDCLVTGGEDCTIRVHYCSGQQPSSGGHVLPTTFADHEGRVTGLALLPNRLLASTSHDKTLRIWDLATMKLLQTVKAHDTPIQCMEFCEERNEIATCDMGNKVKIWDVSKPAMPRLKLLLDHAEVAVDVDDDELNKKKTNMVWLTSSKLEGLPATGSSAADDAIINAFKDVPEVTQVRWVAFRQCWITAADDDMIRLWSPAGERLHAFSYRGGSVQCMLVDNANQLVVVAMMDKNAYVYDLKDPLPLAKYSGHKDVIKGLGYISQRDYYVTASWDKTIRLWQRPAAVPQSEVEGAPERPMQDWVIAEEDENTFVSEYEKRSPLEVPRALLQDHTTQLLAALGILEKTSTGKKPRSRHKEFEVMEEPEAPPGSLGARLEGLNRKMLAEIDAAAAGRPVSNTKLPTLQARQARGSAMNSKHAAQLPKGNSRSG